MLTISAPSGGKLAFVSLADAEYYHPKKKKSAGHKAEVRGRAIQESFSHSKALTTLASVLRALQQLEGGISGMRDQGEFIAPYQDSKLTAVLQGVLTPESAKYASLIGFVDGKGGDTQSIVSCLQFVERCKADWNVVARSS